MITAAEAREFYHNSGIEIDDFLKTKVDPVVKAAASGGKRSVNILLGCLDVYSTIPSKTTPLHRGVVDRLRTLGYIAEIARIGTDYVPKALQDDDGNGRSYTNYGIIISW